MNGGNWDNGADAGLWTLRSNNDPTDTNTNIGGRLANEHRPEAPALPGPATVPLSFGAAVPPVLPENMEQEGAATIGAAPSDPFDRISDWSNLIAAFYAARKAKRRTDEVLAYGAELEERTIIVQQQLAAGTWSPGSPRVFSVLDPKPRLITAPPFADRVVHHAMHAVLEPLFERRFIAQSYACRHGKGVQLAVRSLQQMIRAEQHLHGTVYVLKADISKYFASIGHDRLLGIVGRVTHSDRTVALCGRLLAGYGFDGGTGLPVGALTSQLLANAYLDVLDHYVKDRLGVRWYLRYMDDFAIVGHDKAELWRLCDDIADFLATRLGLRLNRKTTVLPAAGGVDYCGYRVFATHMLPRRATVRRSRRRLVASARKVAAGADIEAELVPKLMSFLGYLKHASASRTRQAVLSRLHAIVDLGEIDVRKAIRDTHRAAARRLRAGRRRRARGDRHLPHP